MVGAFCIAGQQYTIPTKGDLMANKMTDAEKLAKLSDEKKKSEQSEVYIVSN